MCSPLQYSVVEDVMVADIQSAAIVRRRVNEINAEAASIIVVIDWRACGWPRNRREMTCRLLVAHWRIFEPKQAIARSPQMQETKYILSNRQTNIIFFDMCGVDDGVSPTVKPIGIVSP